MTTELLAGIAIAGIIAAAYHVVGRTPFDARTAIIEWLSRQKDVELTVGDLFDLTDWSQE